MTDDTGTALAVIRTALPTILAADQNDILGKLAAKVQAHKPDISTAKGRDAIRSLAAEVASSKVTLVKLGKSLTEDWRAKTKAVNAECNMIEERMDALKEQVRQPLTDFENAEKARVSGHERALEELVSFGVIPAGWPSGHIAMRIEELEASELRRRDWQEFQARASDAFAEVLDILVNAQTVAVNREEQEAEFARLKAAEADRQRLEAIEAQRMREEEIARAAAERATREAEAKAAREAEEARQAAQRAQEDAIRRAEEDAKQARRQALKSQQDAEQAEERRKLEAAKAERDRLQAIADERERIATERLAEVAAEKKRADNIAHRKRINGEALTGIMMAMADDHTGKAEEAEKIAKAIITAIAKGQVMHIKIGY